MSTWLVIPVKSLREGKSRLARALTPGQRFAFMDRLLVHTLTQASVFPGLDQTLVVSACDETRRRAAALGARTLAESGENLNEAIEQALAEVRGLGATRMVVVPCDLPLLCADDLQFLSGAMHSGTVVIAPDRNLSGTNGLCLSAALDFTFEFGPHSYARHIENARRLQLDHLTVQRPGLAFDVDTPDDLAELVGLGGFPAFRELVSAS